MPLNQICLFFLVAVAIGGVGWVFVYPILSGERHSGAAPCLSRNPTGQCARRGRARPPKLRREQVEGTLKDIEQRQKTCSRRDLRGPRQQRRNRLRAGDAGLAPLRVPLHPGNDRVGRRPIRDHHLRRTA